MTAPDLELIVIGVPGPQGSKRHVGHGRMIESSAKVKPWRDAVAWACREAMAGAPPLSGPVVCQMVFVFPRPKSRKKTALHDRKPDLSKLIRSTEDAMTTGGVWEDDARVTAYLDSGKEYADTPAMKALGITSGALIRVWRVT